MKFPYGIADFGVVVQEDYFYVDRTDKIPLIEAAGRQLLFLRPRRFGKSLLLSMLEHYYDLAKADEFEQTFGQLSIGQEPTPLHSQYFVLKWDFSMVSPQGDIDCIRRSLFDHINGEITAFVQKYSHYWQRPVDINKDNAIASLRSVLTSVEQTGYKLYLLIDEYDNFANEVVMSSRDVGKKRYQALLEGEGILKTVFKTLKAAAAGRGLERVFITGVSPIVVSDLTSGYNVVENIFLNSEFNDLCGFTEAELEQTLKDLVQSTANELPPVQETLALMRSFYNGYCFMETEQATQERIYNPTLVLYFLKKFLHDGAYPSHLLDDNLAMDRGKLSYIARLPEGESAIQAAIEGEPPLTLESLVQRFGIEDVLYAKKDRAFMVGLFYYFGILTLQGRDAFGDLCFGVPNQVIFKLYVQQLKLSLLPDWDDEGSKQPVRAFYSRGDLQLVVDLIEQHILPVFDNRDYAQVNELTIKTAFLLLLYNDRLYQMESETRAGKGYVDLALIVRPDARRYPVLDLVLEFKYVSLKQLGMTGQEVRQLKEEACWDLAEVRKSFEQAKEQLGRYCDALHQKYGEGLQLRCYAVLALGLERVLWREVK